MSTRGCVVLALLVVSPLLAEPAFAQQATERFIPIGESPGISGKATLLGRVVSTDAERRVLAVAVPGGIHEVTVTDATRIWLDRSKLGETNVRGSLADCEPGRTIEMKLRGEAQIADWVKVQVSRVSDPGF